MTNKEKAKKLITHHANPEMATFEELVNVAESLKQVAEGLETIETIEGIQGEKGEQGEQGIQGEKGEQGEAGKDGVDGKDGETGPAGKDGSDGRDGIDGTNGIDGINGIDGKDGTDGKDGSPDSPLQIKDKLSSLLKDDRLDISAIKGTEVLQDTIVKHSVDQARGILYAGLLENSGGGGNGVIGATGATGPTGAQGTQGSQGSAGADGVQGATGPQGPQGSQGSAGAQGATGPSGTVAIGDTIVGGTANGVLYLSSSNVLAQTSKLVYFSSDNLYFDQTGTGNSQDTKTIYFKPTYSDGTVPTTFGIFGKAVGGNTYPELIIGGLASGLAKIRIRSLSGAGETIYFHANDLDFSNVSSAILMPKLFLCNPGESPPGSEKLFLRSTSNIVMAIFEQADPNANPVEITYIHNNPWTGAASNGAMSTIRLRTDTTDRMLAANWTGSWADATHASRKGRATFNVYDTAIREGLRIEASGSAPMVGLYGTAAVIQATTAGGASTFTANSSGIADDTATFDGYTIGQVVKALRDIGILA